MTVGELDNNLFTNQSLVGIPTGQISEQEIIRLEFYDYVRKRIDASSVRVQKGGTTGQGFNVTTTYSPHSIGLKSDGIYQARWQIIDGDMVVTAARDTATTLITEMYYFYLQGLETNGKSYTKFKYIQ